MLLGDEHAEEAFFAHEIPDMCRNLVLIVPDFPIVEHLAKLLSLVAEEALLFFRERYRRHGAELFPIGAAGEEFGVEADGAGLDGLLLGLGDGGQDALDHAEHGPRYKQLPGRAPGKEAQDRGRQPAGKRPEPERGPIEIVLEQAYLEEQRYYRK